MTDEVIKKAQALLDEGLSRRDVAQRNTMSRQLKAGISDEVSTEQTFVFGVLVDVHFSHGLFHSPPTL